MLSKLSILLSELERLNLGKEAEELSDIINKKAGRPISLPVEALLNFSERASEHILGLGLSTGLSPFKFIKWAINQSENTVNKFSHEALLGGVNIKGEEYPLIISVFMSNDRGKPAGSLISNRPIRSLPIDLQNSIPERFEIAKIIFIKISPEDFYPRDQRTLRRVEAYPFQQQIEMLLNSFINYIYGVLVHEFTHSTDIVLSEDSPSFSRYQRLYMDPEDKGFYYSTREELKAFLNQIIEDLIPKITYNPEEFINTDLSEYLKKHSAVFREVISQLSENPGDSETPSIQGNLAQRKSRARKYLLSSLYTWWLETKERAKTLL